MEFDLTTPALLFPAISLLLLAYTNRFIVMAKLMRELDEKYRHSNEKYLVSQIKNLRKRIRIIKYMQIFGVSSFLSCAICMFVLFAGNVFLGEWFFGIALVLLILSLLLSLSEVFISIHALEIQSEDYEDK